MWNIRGEILQLGYVLRRQDFGRPVAMLLGRNPAVDQSLPKRSECLFAILVRSKPLGPLVICQHALTIVREPVIKSSALLCLRLRSTWATAARKDCYPDRRVRQDLWLRTGGRPQRRSCKCPDAFQGQESPKPAGTPGHQVPASALFVQPLRGPPIAFIVRYPRPDQQRHAVMARKWHNRSSLARAQRPAGASNCRS